MAALAAAFFFPNRNDSKEGMNGMEARMSIRGRAPSVDGAGALAIGVTLRMQIASLGSALSSSSMCMRLEVAWIWSKSSTDILAVRAKGWYSCTKPSEPEALPLVYGLCWAAVMFHHCAVSDS
eukprot:CAMPEP_0177755498 /NCGR_PEP_ID=MMETSP0491_2-20121128/2598_1 /TAXON_ID=63592 /ORGANISM="Tetraselmis chuii, Strain PLY429" /LENGTH=122 /DNA_ID=CAMNT_0019270999 /DNA_START=222 /DNA_END=590 /DNA_ORIENTATION=+